MRQSPQQQAILALLLLVPAPSLGVMMAVIVLPGPVGQAIFTASKVWLLALPLIWTHWIEGQPILHLKPFQPRDLALGLGSGLLALGAIAGAYALLGPHWIDTAEVRLRATQAGITGPGIYWAGAAWWTLANALIEEYVWRNFVTRKCEALVPAIAAVSLAALFFTVHHIVALVGYLQDWRVVLLGSLGVFLAGVIWSFFYQQTRSIWPSYLSHLLADVGIALVGWHLLFSPISG